MITQPLSNLSEPHLTSRLQGLRASLLGKSINSSVRLNRPHLARYYRPILHSRSVQSHHPALRCDIVIQEWYSLRCTRVGTTPVPEQLAVDGEEVHDLHAGSLHAVDGIGAHTIVEGTTGFGIHDDMVAGFTEGEGEEGDA